MVSARNSPCVESRKVQMGKPDRGDAFHTMWCCWAPISQDALAAAILSGCNQHSAHSHENCRNTEKILQRLSRGSFLRGCERNAGGFPWKASLLLRSSTSEWRAAAALKVPCPVSWLLFLSFFFFLLQIILLFNSLTTLHRIVASSYLWKQSFIWVWPVSVPEGVVSSILHAFKPLSCMKRLKWCRKTHKTQLKTSGNFSTVK